MPRRGRKRKIGNRVNGRLVQKRYGISTLPAGHSAIYVMWAEGTSLVKVGLSATPARRCLEIQVGMPLTVSIRGVFPAPEELAVKIEASFHRTHCAQPYHVRGEWYRLEPVEANRLVAIEAAKFGVKLDREKIGNESSGVSSMHQMWNYYAY